MCCTDERAFNHIESSQKLKHTLLILCSYNIDKFIRIFAIYWTPIINYSMAELPI